MNRWWKKLRGLVGLTALGGAVGGVFGAVGTAITGFLGGGIVTAELLFYGGVAWGGIAAVASAGVGLFLAAGGRRKSLAELSAVKAGVFGMLIGAAAPLLLNLGIRVVLLGLAPTVSVSVVASMAIGGTLCGALGAGFVTAAQRADAGRLEAPSEDLLPAGE